MRKPILALALAVAAPAFAVTTPATDFPATPLPGTTAAMEPYLAGSVIVDKVVPFAPSGGAPGGIRGKVQVRILKRASGTLDFYYQVTNDASSTGPITVAQVRGFPKLGYDVNWRQDGLGDVAPQTIAGAMNGAVWVLAFQFGQPIAPGQKSRFFFVSSGYHSWASDPNTILRLRTSDGSLVAYLPIPTPRP